MFVGAAKERTRVCLIPLLQSGSDVEEHGLAEGLLFVECDVVGFRRWELNNIRAHIEAGLPTSDDVFDRVTTLLHGAKLKKFVNANWVKAIRVYHDSFLWSAVDCDLAVDIAIVAVEDEQFLDAIADFLLNSLKG